MGAVPSTLLPSPVLRLLLHRERTTQPQTTSLSTENPSTASQLEEQSGRGVADFPSSQTIPPKSFLSSTKHLYYGPQLLVQDPVYQNASSIGDPPGNVAGGRTQDQHRHQTSACATLKSLLNVKKSTFRLFPRHNHNTSVVSHEENILNTKTISVSTSSPYLFATNSSNDEEGPVNPPNSSSRHPLYGVEFTFDAMAPCRIRVLWFVEETRKGLYLTHPQLSIPPADFPEGLNQHFILPDIHQVQVHRYLEDLTSNRLSDVPKNEVSTRLPQSTEPTQKKSSRLYPLVVLIETVDDRDDVAAGTSMTLAEINKIPQSRQCKLITYVDFVANSEGTYDAKISKQKMEINGASYLLHEIYGLAESPSSVTSSDTLNNPTNASNEELSLGSKECVVCMSEPKDTTVLPCRHLCLCKTCAETLRNQSNKCPICRQVFQALLRIVLPRRRHRHADESFGRCNIDDR